jgi:hypothetical protein
MLIYQCAIDANVDAGEGADWSAQVQAELEAVIAAPTTGAAAEVIAWWLRAGAISAIRRRRLRGRIRRHAARELKM